ncbi:MAG: hypothetical protein RBT05_09695 [Bacteroidales bacterium]|jgi:uncharacterized protein (DUF486 family)|nr:hypothetical protein [Bacteroidales bacterium]
MDITSSIIIGAAVSLIVQYLKKRLGTTSAGTMLAVITISIVAGTAYFFIKDTSLWEPIISILGFAGAVYTFIFRRFEE